MTNRIEPQPGERFTGHGAEWRDANLSPSEARMATVEALSFAMAE